MIGSVHHSGSDLPAIRSTEERAIAKIAFVKLPSTYANWYRRPMLGISYVSAYVEQHGLESNIFDALYHGWSEDELLQRITAYGPDIIGMTAMTHEVTRAARFVDFAKRRLQVPVVVGGPHATALPAATLAEFGAFDYGIVGEGEQTMLELAQALDGDDPGRALPAITGLVYRQGTDVVVNEKRPWLVAEELDQLPYPAFHHYYGDDSRALAGKGKYYVMFSARGCPYHCAFCMQVLGNQVRGFSPERICDEIEFAIKRYGAHTIDFADEIFLFNSKRTRDTLELMISRSLHKQVRWKGLTRANMVNPDLIDLAKQSGCYRLEMGVESGNDAILRDIGKHITVEQVRDAVRIIKERGISLETYYILGHPNETPETAKQTADLAVSLNTDDIAFGLMVPYPGTDIRRRAQQEVDGYRLLSEDWSQYDKFGGKTLELNSLTYDELVRHQKRAYLRFYLENRRFADLLAYVWQRRHAVRYFVARKLSALYRKVTVKGHTQPVSSLVGEVSNQRSSR